MVMHAKKNRIPENMKEIPGHPGLYTPVEITRDPRKEKALWTKIMKGAEKLTAERHARESLLAPKGKNSKLRAAFPFLKF